MACLSTASVDQFQGLAKDLSGLAVEVSADGSIGRGSTHAFVGEVEDGLLVDGGGVGELFAVAFDEDQHDPLPDDEGSTPLTEIGAPSASVASCSTINVAGVEGDTLNRTVTSASCVTMAALGSPIRRPG